MGGDEVGELFCWSGGMRGRMLLDFRLGLRHVDTMWMASSLSRVEAVVLRFFV